LKKYRDGDKVSEGLDKFYTVLTEEVTETDDLMVLLPEDIPGVLQGGRFLSGPLQGSWVSDHPAREWIAEQSDVFKKIAFERVIDVNTAALAIQTFWRFHRASQRLSLPHRLLVRKLAALRARYVLAGRISSLGFNASLANSRSVVLSENNQVATYIGKKSVSNFVGFGVLLGQEPLHLITDKFPCLYFEVEILGMAEGKFPDGLTLGVTEALPQAAPETCDGLGRVWAVGFDGEAFSSDSGDFEKVDWNPQSLKVGDKVGCLVVYPAGDLLITVNGNIATDGPTGIPEGLELYPVVDMLGAVTKVKWSSWKMIPAVELASSEDESSQLADTEIVTDKFQAPETLPDLRFAIDLLNPKTLRLSPDYLTLTYVAPKRAPAKYQANGVAVTHNPIEMASDNMLYFEVELTETIDGFPDGLTIGFTSLRPTDPSQMPDICDGLPGDSWLAGFDGEAFSSSKGDFEDIGWNPKTLKAGDRLGALVIYPAGDLVLLVNGGVVAEGPSGVPRAPLFGVVDLIGAANAVRIVSNPSLPVIELAS